jgi:phenylalanyl-tRNA synthetase beta chain
MKTPLSWISLYTPLESLLAKHSTKELAHEYSIHTAEIDGIEEHFLDKVVVGKVISCEKHPESKKLSIVRVNLGNIGEETILTGAANIVDTIYVAVAVVGAVLPGDFVIGERMMAGMMSRGMICSDDELGLATERAEGIMNLEEHWDADTLETMLGKSFFDLTLPFVGLDGNIYNYPLRDTTFEIDNKFITNRPDLFSVYGNAREWHAVFDIPYSSFWWKELSRSDWGFSGTKNLPPFGHPLSKEGLETFPVTIETNKVFSYYAVKMEWVNVDQSPFGMRIMMERAGLTPKMDIVDITNCIMTEFGQPMHAFDADKIIGGIIVRMARSGEKILALNGTEYELTPDDMVIADHEKPIAVAWVIGGMESAVSRDTKNIIWESACFDPINVRLTSQRLGIRTDSSTRYEKSLDPLLPASVLPRVLEYMEFLGKSINITATSSYLDEKRVNQITIDIDYEFINMKAGVEIPRETVNAILERLGFGVSIIPGLTRNPSENKDSSWITGFLSSQEWQSIRVTVPSWRASKDISIKEDIAEEVARVYGYDTVPLTPLTANFSISQKNTDISLRNNTLEFFSKRGWNEAYNYSFTSEKLDTALGMSDMSDAIWVRNAFNEDYTHMRRSLANRLFENITVNTKYSEHLQFFEIGKVYSKTGKMNAGNAKLLEKQTSKPFAEQKMIAGVTTGKSLLSFRENLEDFLTESLGYLPPLYQWEREVLPFLHPGVSGEYREGDIVIARFGQVHPMSAEAYDIPASTLYFEVDYEVLLELQNDKEILFHPISKYQTIPRELNFVLTENTRTGDIAHMIDATHPWIQNVVVDSIYRDDAKIGKNKKSVNFSFILSNIDGTISDEDALMVQNAVIEKMREQGYGLRQ